MSVYMLNKRELLEINNIKYNCSKIMQTHPNSIQWYKNRKKLKNSEINNKICVKMCNEKLNKIYKNRIVLYPSCIKFEMALIFLAFIALMSKPIKGLTSIEQQHQQDILRQQQQRQFQKQHLFALLTSNNQQTSISKDRIENGFKNLPKDLAISHLSRRGLNRKHENMMDTKGFVSDDSQQYEKALSETEAFAALNTKNKKSSFQGLVGTGGSNSCPKECTCLNDFFDCGKKNLNYIPNLPSYVQVL